MPPTPLEIQTAIQDYGKAIQLDPDDAFFSVILR
jgi:hypothetical protein